MTRMSICRSALAQCVVFAALVLAGCAVMEARDDAETSRPVGAAGGNVLDIQFDRDRRTTTVLGGLVGAGAGFWHGHPTDAKLRRAQATSLELANLEAQAKYPFEQPLLYAREPAPGSDERATFERLEAHLPADAVRARSGDVSVILRKLGGFAAREEETVRVEAPDSSAIDYITIELRAGAAPRFIAILTTLGAEPRVIIGAAGR